jgi:hypothetical protein
MAAEYFVKECESPKHHLVESVKARTMFVLIITIHQVQNGRDFFFSCEAQEHKEKLSAFR